MTLQTKDLRLNNLLEVDGVIIQVGKIEEKHITWNLSKKDNLTQLATQMLKKHFFMLKFNTKPPVFLHKTLEGLIFRFTLGL